MELYDYKRIDACESTRNIDRLLEQYERERQKITTIALEKPETLKNSMWKILSSDSRCQCLMGQGNINTLGKCPQCKNLSRITDFKTNHFTIECGKLKGKMLYIQKFTNVSPFIKTKDLPLSISRRYLTQCDFDKCEPGAIKNEKTTYIALDTFSNGALINLLLQHFNDTHIQKLYTAFLCGRDGYYLTENPEITFETLKLNPDVVRGIVYQLLSLCQSLSKYDFTHGKPSTNSLVFTEKSINLKKYKVKSPFTLKLRNFENSGITVNNTRFYSSSTLAETYARRNIYSPNITTTIDNVSYFKLTNDTATFFLHLRYMGVAMYTGAFDFYAFMVAMMANKTFYDVVVNDASLFELWKAMWRPEDLQKVVERLGKYSTPLTTEQIIEVIKGIELRCDIVNYLS